MTAADGSSTSTSQLTSKIGRYEARFYRVWTGGDQTHPLKRIHVIQDESDLDLYYTGEIVGVEEALRACRAELISHIENEPDFLTSLVPILEIDTDTALIRQMKNAALLAGVGPMAAVAGAVAQRIGERYKEINHDVIVENGGDLYLSLVEDRRVLIYAGTSPFSNRLAILVKASETPLGICTSSGTFGHSLSFGNADAVVAVATDAALADAAATAVANLVKSTADIETAVQFASAIPGLKGVVVIVGDKIGLWGGLELIPIAVKTTF